MKLIRDNTPDLLRGTTRTVHNEEEHKLLLRMKLMEEAAEVAASTSKEEMVLEFGDLFEVLTTLAYMEGITMEEIQDAMFEKHERKGGFTGGLVLMHDPLSNKTTATV